MGEIKIKKENFTNYYTTVECPICGELVDNLTEYEAYALSKGQDIGPKVCKKCKDAIMYIRNLKEINAI